MRIVGRFVAIPSYAVAYLVFTSFLADFLSTAYYSSCSSVGSGGRRLSFALDPLLAMSSLSLSFARGTLAIQLMETGLSIL